MNGTSLWSAPTLASAFWALRDARGRCLAAFAFVCSDELSAVDARESGLAVGFQGHEVRRLLEEEPNGPRKSLAAPHHANRNVSESDSLAQSVGLAPHEEALGDLHPP